MQPQKVLRTQIQDHKNILLIKWKGHTIEHATWEPADKFRNINPLIQQYERSKLKDQRRNFGLINSQKIDIGSSPYEQTSKHGHFMFGDEPSSIESINVYENKNVREKRKTVICEIAWKNRVEFDSEGRETHVILQNSFIESATIMQFRPDFLVKQYQRLIVINE